MSAGRRGGALLLVLAAAWLSSCRGETVYLGDDPGTEGGQPDGEPCNERSDCENRARPYCNPESERCVECLYDRQCASGICINEERAGECVGSLSD